MLNIKSTVTVIAVLLAISIPVVAQESAETTAPGGAEIEASFGDWSKVCQTNEAGEGESEGSAEKSCQIVQAATQNESGQRILQTSIGYADNGTPVLTLTAPLGIYLPRGITVSVDNTPITATISRCSQNGCVGQIQMQESLIEAMKNNNNGAVLVATTPDNNLKLPLSLKGFTAAFASLQ